MDAECGECDMIVDDLPKPQTLEGTVEYQVQSRASVVQINRYSWREPREAVFKADAPIIDILLSRRFAELDASFLESSRPEPRPVGDILFMPPNYTLHSRWDRGDRSEEHTSELQSLMRISYAVFCLKKNNNTTIL